MRILPRPVRSLARFTIALLAILFATTPAGAQRRAIARRASAEAPAPTTSATITVGGTHYAGLVDAQCAIDERATPSNGRFYYHAMYPWFGARPAPDQPQWRFELGVPRPARDGTNAQFVFSFLNGTTSGTIQTLANAQRMGGGTVRLTHVGTGMRFTVDGRSKEGDAIHATIDCASFPASERAGG
jgi:hypothetical protein